MFEQDQREIADEIRSICKQYGIPHPGEIKWNRIPFSGKWGISTSFFQVAAEEARSGKQVNVPARAQEIAELVATHLGEPGDFSRVEAVKGYLNLYYSAPKFAQRVVENVLAEGLQYGKGTPKDQRVMVEFSQPNTHKAMHVGHLRSMMVGAAVANILEFAGFQVVRANYLGDFGRDVMKWIWNYRKHHMGEQPDEHITRWMGEMYAESTRNLESDPDGEAELQQLFERWDAGDPEIVALWQKTRQWSVDGFNQIYEWMSIEFDCVYCESEMEKPAKEYVADLIERNIAIDERPEGPVIVKLDELLGLDKETYRTLVLLRSDSSSLYGAWDLTLAQKKFQDYELDKSIYVVDVRQSLHFKQVFKTLEIAGFDEIEKAYHLPFEVINLPGNVTMKSREGMVVLLEDFLREAQQRAREIVEEKNPELAEEPKNEVARAVAIGAIKYSMLARENTSIATFDWESALDFNGQAAPYIQYAHVRCSSILRRLDGPIPENVIPQHELTPSEIELIEQISRLPEEVQRAAREYKTLHVTNLAYELARAFNNFYNECPVLQAEPAVRDARINLVVAARHALANSLNLLGITAPEMM